MLLFFFDRGSNMGGPGDLDGDGKFDGIDISIMDDDRGTNLPSNNAGSWGCCILLLVHGSTVATGWLCVTNYLIS